MQKAVFASMFLLVSVFAVSFAIPSSRGALIGMVCIDSAMSTSCPLSPPTFSGHANIQLTVSVNIQGSDIFSGFDLQVKTDPTILNPVTDNVMPDVLLSPLILVNCINGVGFNCSPGDGPGIVHVAVAGSPVSTPDATGRLFTITYNIASKNASTTVGYETGCTTSSNDGNCVLFTNTAALVVPENVQTAIFHNHKNLG